MEIVFADEGILVDRKQVRNSMNYYGRTDKEMEVGERKGNEWGVGQNSDLKLR